MTRYLIRRIVQIVPVLLIITLVVFTLVYVAGDPVTLMLSEDATPEDVEAMRQALGLDKPFYIQYLKFIGGLLQGDFGTSFRYNQSALPIVLERLPATFQLAGLSMVFAILISVPLGILSARKQNSVFDLFITGASILGKAMPNFWLGIILILVFAVNMKLLPVSGTGSFMHIVLPAITLGTSVAAEMTRLIRSSMLEVLNQDYIRTAKSKGIANFLIVYKHAFRNTLIPVITIAALQLSTLVSGALITESIFAWPGLGLLLVQAVNGKDMAIVQASVFVIAILVIVINLITDIIYMFLDPKIVYK